MGMSLGAALRGCKAAGFPQEGPGGTEPGPPGQLPLPQICEKRQARGFLGSRELGMLQHELRWGKTQSPATATVG